MEKDNVSIIKEEIQRLTGILDSWKDFSGEIKLDRAETDMIAVLADVVRMISLQDQRVKVAFKQKEGEKYFAPADKDKIKQVLLNLAINSLQAMSGTISPELKIDILKKSGFITVKMRDNGSGISKEDMGKLKQPLFTTKAKGTGLGLAVSERIIKAHGGSLIFNSDGRTYTEATVSIPEK